MHSDLFDARRAAPPGGRRGWDPTLRKEWTQTEDWFYRSFPAYFVTGVLLFLFGTFLSIGVSHAPELFSRGLAAYQAVVVLGVLLFGLIPSAAATKGSLNRADALSKALVVAAPGTAFAVAAGLLPLAGLSPFLWGHGAIAWYEVVLRTFAATAVATLAATLVVGIRSRRQASRVRGDVRVASRRPVASR